MSKMPKCPDVQMSKTINNWCQLSIQIKQKVKKKYSSNCQNKTFKFTRIIELESSYSFIRFNDIDLILIFVNVIWSYNVDKQKCNQSDI